MWVATNSKQFKYNKKGTAKLKLPNCHATRERRDSYSSKKCNTIVRLYRITYVPIDYQVKIRGAANPYFKEYDKYFYSREQKRKKLAEKCKQKTLHLEKKNTDSRLFRR